jgi:hypothetical protein
MANYPSPQVKARVVARIRERVPHALVGEVEHEVARIFDEMSDCKVKDFLPILVERQVVEWLQAPRLPSARVPEQAVRTEPRVVLSGSPLVG